MGIPSEERPEDEVAGNVLEHWCIAVSSSTLRWRELRWRPRGKREAVPASCCGAAALRQRHLCRPPIERVRECGGRLKDQYRRELLMAAPNRSASRVRSTRCALQN